MAGAGIPGEQEQLVIGDADRGRSQHRRVRTTHADRVGFELHPASPFTATRVLRIAVRYVCVFNTELYPMAMEQPKRRRSTTRARLLEGALEVFAERGFQGASVEDICDRAGFTRGAFYSNFGSKDELVLALLQSTTDRLLEQIAALVPGLANQPGTLLDAVLGLLDEAARDQRQWHLVSTEFTLHALRNPAAARALAEQRALFREQLTNLVEEITATSGLRLNVPADQFVRMVIALHEGARAQSLLEPDDVPAGSLEHTFLPMVLDAISRP